MIRGHEYTTDELIEALNAKMEYINQNLTEELERQSYSIRCLMNENSELK